MLKLGRTKEEIEKQEVVYFDHMMSRHQCNWYKQQYGKVHTNFLAIGDILHWWYVYDDLHMVENIVIGDGKVYYPSDTVIATFKPNKDLGMPIFNFINNYRNLNDCQRIYIKGLIKMRRSTK
jgi:hypothetical protein